jgi:hypothetical protein
MNKLFPPKIYYQFAFVVCMISITSCNSGGSVDPSPKALALTGTLDTLWVDSATFVQLDSTKKAVFEFRIGGIDTLTMDGWTPQDTGGFKFNNLPNISLLKGRGSSLNYGPGIYLGNQILRKGQIKKIQDKLASKNAQFVLFAPNISSGHISYDIFVGVDNPKAKSNVVFTAPPSNTNQSSNPSPPKTYSN